MFIVSGSRALSGRGAGVALGLLLALSGKFAQASDSPFVSVVKQSIKLQFSTAALADPAQSKLIYSRLRIAAQRVCHLPGDEISNGRDADACIRQAVDAAVVDLDSAPLTAQHAARRRGLYAASYTPGMPARESLRR